MSSACPPFFITDSRVLFTKTDGVLYGQEIVDPHPMRIHLIIVGPLVGAGDDKHI